MQMVNEKGRENVPMWDAFQPTDSSSAAASESAGSGSSSAGLEAAAKKFSVFFTRVLLMQSDHNLSYREQTAFLTFLSHAFESLENEVVRRSALRLLSLPTWLAVSPSRVDLELTKYPALQKPWKRVLKDNEALKSTSAQYDEKIFVEAHSASDSNDGEPDGGPAGGKRKPAGDGDAAAAAAAAGEAASSSTSAMHRSGKVACIPSDPAAFLHLQKRLDCSFIPSLLCQFYSVLESIPGPGQQPSGSSAAAGDGGDKPQVDPAHVRFCERFMELVVDLLTQLPTRRFFRLLLEDSHFILRCKKSGLARRSPNAPSPYSAGASSSAAGSGSNAASQSSISAASSAGLVGGAVVDDDVDDGEWGSASAADASAGSSTAGAAGGRSSAHFGASYRLEPGFEGRLFGQLLDMASFFMGFEIDDQTGKALSDRDVEAVHYSRVAALQALCYKFFAKESREMREFALGATGVVSQPETLKSYLNALTDEQLMKLATNLRLLPTSGHYQVTQKGASSATTSSAKKQKSDDGSAAAASSTPSTSDSNIVSPTAVTPFVPQPKPSRRYVLEVILDAHARRRSQLRAINGLPLYPSEQLLWDPNLVPAGNRFSGNDVLALPKLNLQFLTLYDYLLRCFNLFRLESAYEIRADLVDAIRRLAPRQSLTYDKQGYATNKTLFTGWSRMALPIDGFGLKSILPPHVGGEVPAGVSAEVKFDISKYAPHIRQEWDGLREHDVCFLVTIRCPVPPNVHPDDLRDPALLAKYTGVGAAAAAVNADDGSAAAGEDDGDAAMTADGDRKQDDKQPQKSKQQPHGNNRQQRPERVSDEEDFTFPLRYGIVAVRGCEVYEIADEKGEVFNDPSQREDRNRRPVGTKRTLRVNLDPAQYHADAVAVAKDGKEPIYDTFNIIIRRDPKSNNFKAILETVRDVMNSSAQGGAVPAWLHDIFLGYGDAGAAFFRNLPEGIQIDDMDFRDTFVSAQHLIDCFPDSDVVFKHEESGALIDASLAQPPFRVRFERSTSSSAASASTPGRERVIAIPYSMPSPGPYPEDIPKSNTVPFTPVQVEAIRAGLNPGLTLVVGPPGTGKTDTAVQIIANLYHNFPSQKVCLVTHSNQALNDLFDKLLKRDVAERHVLRLGQGERELETEGDFSKAGRVAAAMERRTACLAEVERLGQSLSIPGDFGYTCETAEYFNLHHIKSRIDTFRARFGIPAPPMPTGLEPAGGAKGASRLAHAAAVKATSIYAAANEEGAAARVRYRKSIEDRMAGVDPKTVLAAFPFTNFVSNAPNGGIDGIFKGVSSVDDVLAAESCFRHLATLFDELQSHRAFELLRSQRARTDYLLVKQARIVAMTCTHAAIMRSHFIALDFKYDTLVMEEAGQVLEVETLIPMLLQKPDVVSNSATGGEPQLTPRLKRVILIGDHNQLPPVVQNMAFAKYAKLDQSMFARFVRLSVPAIQLNAQGRARPSIAALYNWRYKALGDLPNTVSAPQYRAANAGFALDYQLIDVPDYEGKGESAPSPHFYQNLGEAEYLVAVYQYMRLMGYPATSIAILTTYNGQKALLRDVIRRRCAPYPIFGEPSKIETVDKYQGQQADYILLSLVRTKTVGHLRDVRRLVVAMSRARLGLYVFARQSIFSNCYELAPTFSRLGKRPSKLQLVVGEQHPTPRDVDADASVAVAASGGVLSLLPVEGVLHMGSIVQHILGAQMAMNAAMAASAAAASVTAASQPAAAPVLPSAEEGEQVRLEASEAAGAVGEELEEEAEIAPE